MRYKERHFGLPRYPDFEMFNGDEQSVHSYVIVTTNNPESTHVKLYATRVRTSFNGTLSRTVDDHRSACEAAIRLHEIKNIDMKDSRGHRVYEFVTSINSDNLTFF